ncbi:transporter TonB [Methylogaea oryzae]|uniref:Transporter TonB n=1 Tax=Methylogaea oryzae TaxID=1295382 RepID=A0A8D5AGP9_9GAMM|nr:transporter TonB [Methylogaea oryzae]
MLAWGEGSTDRLSLALFLAALLHAVVILGVSFSAPDRPREREPLEITLSHLPSKQAPKKADYLAPENQVGGGEGKTKAAPQVEAAPSLPSGGQPQAGEADTDQPAPSQQQPLLTQSKSAHHKIAAAPAKDKRRRNEAPQSIDLAAVQRQISEFSNEFVQAQEQYAKQSKILYVNSVSAHKYAAAAYEKAWQDKIERVGNLNYPDEARRQSLSGSLLLSVGINKDGTIHSIKVRQSSGHVVLDDAAKRIVELAAPFAPFPAGLREEADVLVITRTWKFFSDSHLSTGP